ncbi:MAG: phosphatase PAP2 family protein, partial [Rhodospirillales bacterium]|nr:phosphatase PAP2 family protein [Rhodospirillales bacterium]
MSAGFMALARRNPALIWLTAMILASALAMAFIDKPLALYLKGHVSGPVEGFFKVLTELGVSQVSLVPAALVWAGCLGAARLEHFAAARGRLLRYAHAAAFLFLSVAASGLLVNAMKFLIGRMRPRHLFESGLYGFIPFNHVWSMNSFPSGHSQTIWAAMTALLFILPRYDVLWLLVAVLVSLSRLVTTVHYFSDVLFGSYLGIALTVL